MSCPRLVPPAPHVINRLFMDYVHEGKPYGMTFRQYLRAVGYSDPAADIDGMDDGAVAVMPADGPMMVSVPRIMVRGRLRIIVLLVDFPDADGTRPVRQFEDLLFSDRVYPTGSMRDYYREVSGGRVDVSGTVHGWLRLPQRLRDYANGSSGLRGPDPRNARQMALDAVLAARQAGVVFPAELDALGTGTVTGLFIVHAGPGAEVLDRSIAGQFIWSHKWDLATPVRVAPGLFAATYLTVPEDCFVGVCAHELGHLAFQWEDFYDPNGGDDGVQWAGTGAWDLMASGSYNGAGFGTRPAHPMALHKSQHGWVDVLRVNATRRIEIPPYTAAGGAVVRVDGPGYRRDQFLLLENRRRVGFDDALPSEGLLVWRVDLAREQTGPSRPAVQLVQADGRQDLETDLNQGDAGDPFPGSTRLRDVRDTGLVSTSFPGGRRSGVTLSDVTVDPLTGVVAVTITIAPAVPAPAAPATDDRAAASAGEEYAGPPAPLPQVGMVPAEPKQMIPAGLANLMRQPRITPDELEPLVRAVTPTPLDLQRRVLAAEAGAGPMPPAAAAGEAARIFGLGGRFADPSSFDGWWFARYKANFGVAWDKQGEFQGVFDPNVHLLPRGESDYLYTPDRNNPLRFVRSSGEMIQPGNMVTDGGSVPRPAWVIPDIDPLTYIKAYLVHDWDFSRHHCDDGYGRDFDGVNLTLGEGIYTLMRAGEVGTDWRKVELVYQAVSSFVGRAVWDRRWNRPAECPVALPGNDPPGTT